MLKGRLVGRVAEQCRDLGSGLSSLQACRRDVPTGVGSDKAS